MLADSAQRSGTIFEKGSNMIFQVFDGETYVGIIVADNEEEAQSKARLKSKSATVRPVQYRSELESKPNEDCYSFSLKTKITDLPNDNILTVSWMEHYDEHGELQITQLPAGSNALGF
jgi:hypothetical protein